MTAQEMLEAFDMRFHWKIREWEEAGADPAALTRLGQSRTCGDLVDYVRLRCTGQPVPSHLVDDIRMMADLDRRAAFERIHASYEERG